MYRLAPGQESEIYSLFSVTSEQGAGVLKLMSELDYEKRNLYQVKIEARDRAGLGNVNIAIATVVVKVTF